jgi:multidrug efflux system outer membrane protein
VVQNIIQDVRFAYWRAVSAQRLLPQMNAILDTAEDTLQAVDVLHQFSIQDPMIYLQYKQELLNLILDMWNLRQDLQTARAEFAALINLPPGENFSVVDTLDNMVIPEMQVKIDRLEGYALANRPDIIQEHYQARISAEEIKKAMVRMLPGLEISLGGNYDSNKFLVNNSWNQFGLNLSWNIFNLFTGQDAINAAEARHELDNMRRMSLSMAVLTQVHLAVQRYNVARKVYEVSNQLHDVEQQMVKQITASEQAEMQNEMEVLRTRVSALLATMTRDVSYAELQNAYGRIQSSIGVDPLPESVTSSAIDDLAAAIEQNENDWQTRLQ